MHNLISDNNKDSFSLQSSFTPSCILAVSLVFLCVLSLFTQKGCHILVATPGRLQDFVDRNRVSFASIRFVVLDEADRMLDMGFLGNIERMMEHDSMTPKVSDASSSRYSRYNTN